jgi:predicted acylesterase/phospholipase RssA
VDLVGGASIGSIFGATFAMGMDYEDNMELARRLASPLKLFDPTIPVVSFFASGKVTQVLERIYGDTQIEDLWMPCFCISSNLTHAITMVHRRGSLWQATRASMAIPGIFSPILAEGDLLVDGCVLNNLPIDVMQRLNHGGPIIAVNVFPDVDMLRDYQFGPSICGWQALVGRLNPLRRKDSGAPLIFESLLRVLALNDVHQAKTKRGLADVYIRPPVEQYNILDFGAYEQIARIGYRSAMEALGEWEGLPKRDGPPLTTVPRPAPAASSPGNDVTAPLHKALGDLEDLLGGMSG